MNWIILFGGKCTAAGELGLMGKKGVQCNPYKADYLLFGRETHPDRRGFLKKAGLAMMGAMVAPFLIPLRMVVNGPMALWHVLSGLAFAWPIFSRLLE